MPDAGEVIMSREERSDGSRLVERAAALVPLLREHALECEQIRRVPEASFAALRASGLLGLFLGKRYGGHEVNLRTCVDAMAELGRGCGSTAWVAAQINCAVWVASLFPRSTRDEIFGEPEAYMAAVLGGRGSVTRAPGGYLLDAIWPFCSGCHHVRWILVAMPVEGDDEKAPLMFLVPASQVEILDDWHVSGLAGTCSNSVATRGVFVPEHRAMSMVHFIKGEPVPTEPDGALYRSPMLQTVLATGASVALGIARAAIDDFKATAQTRGISQTQYERRADAPVTHLQVAEAEVKLSSARLTLHRAVDDIELSAERGGAMDMETRIRVRMDMAYAVSLCREAVDLLFSASGGSALSLSNPIQRASRDMAALSVHAAYAMPTNLERYGRVLMGLSPNTQFI